MTGIIRGLSLGDPLGNRPRHIVFLPRNEIHKDHAFLGVDNNSSSPRLIHTATLLDDVADHPCRGPSLGGIDGVSG